MPSAALAFLYDLLLSSRIAVVSPCFSDSILTTGIPQDSVQFFWPSNSLTSTCSLRSLNSSQIIFCVVPGCLVLSNVGHALVTFPVLYVRSPGEGVSSSTIFLIDR